MKLFSNAHKREKENRKKMEAELQYRQMQRQFNRCAATLEQLSAERKRAAFEAEKAGRHESALREVRFIRKLDGMHNRIVGLSTRMEMMFAMQGISSTLSEFMTSCAGLSPMLQGMFDPSKLASGQVDLEKMMTRMDGIIERTDMMFEGLASDGESAGYADPDAEAELRRIIGERDAEIRRDRLFDDQHRAISATNAQLDERLQQLKAASN